MTDRCFLDHSQFDLPEWAAQRASYAKSTSAWQLTVGACEGEVLGRDVNDRLTIGLREYERDIPLCEKHFPAFVAHRMVKGARVRAVKGRKVKPGLEGVVKWIGMHEKFNASRYDSNPFELRIGVVVDGTDVMAFCDPDNFTVIAPPEPQTATCERCGASFTDGPDGVELTSAVSQRRDHERAEHPRPRGPRVHLGADGAIYTARDSVLWATCDTHGLVRPYLVEWTGWGRDEAGKWQRETYAIATAERVALPREDGTDSTVEVDRTFCETCLAPSLLRVIKLRKSTAKTRARKPKPDGLTYCGGECLHGMESCDCMCAGMCHGAARGGLGRALMLEGLSRAYAAAKAAGDTAAADDLQKMLREVIYPCPGHSRAEVAQFYGREE